MLSIIMIDNYQIQTKSAESNWIFDVSSATQNVIDCWTDPRCQKKLNNVSWNEHILRALDKKIIQAVSLESFTALPCTLYLYLFIYLSYIYCTFVKQSVPNKKYICIISCQTEKLGKKNQIKIQKCLSKLVGTVKSINSTRAGNLIVDCIDNQQYKKLLKTTHLGVWIIKGICTKITEYIYRLYL